MGAKVRAAVAALTLSAVGFGSWVAHEGYSPKAYIPTKGDVPTIGHGSTRYEDGRKVKMGDTIDRKRAAELARNLISEDERKLRATLPGVKLHQHEWDAYVDFVGQYGLGNWAGSSMRRELLAGRYAPACKAMLKYRYAAGFDCSTPGNKRCAGVWTRQQERVAKCLGQG